MPHIDTSQHAIKIDETPNTVLTVDQLFTAQTFDQVKERLLAALRRRLFPVTDWNEGAVERTLVEMHAEATSDMVSGLIPILAASGFIDFAETEWLTLLAKQMYRLDRNAATKTTGSVTLSCVLGAGPITLATKDLIIESISTGNRYVGPLGVGPFIVPDGGSLVVSVESEFANDTTANPPRSYTDPNNSLARLVTVIPGLSVINPQPDFTPVFLLGSGSGTITPSRTVPASPPVAATLAVLVTASGQVGAATWSLSVDGGPFTPQGVVPAFFDVPAKNTRLTFANGAFVPSFILSDIYTVASPGSWITVQGVDLEADAALQERSRSRWPTLGLVPTEDVYEFLARSASEQVTQVRVSADLVVPGRVNIIIAGPAGALPLATVNTVQAFINLGHPLTDFPVVASAVANPIVLAGVATCVSGKIAAAQPAATTNVAVYIGGVGVGGIVRLAAIIEAIMITDGLVDLSGLTINGLAANEALASNEVATFTQNLATALTWVPA
jgi:hypothetical protein